MQDRTDSLERIVAERLAGKRNLFADELAPCAGESALIAAHVDRFRNRLTPADAPFGLDGAPLAADAPRGQRP